MADRVAHTVTSNEFVESELHEALQSIASATQADVITYVGSIYEPIDDVIRTHIERIDPKRPRLAIVLETTGGVIETAERIATVFRHFYEELWFLVPNQALSAGTVLVMCGDRIYMDYYSTLGPIDPQVENDNGHLVPALGYLAEYNQMVQRSSKGQLTTAELTSFVENFDAADLYSYKQARDLSIDLLETWLVTWKFKDWSETEGKQSPVTLEMKRKRARQIARKLNDPKRWKSHGRGITKDVLWNELKLKINGFEDETGLAYAIQRYYPLLKDYMMRRGRSVAVHTYDHFFVGEG